MKVYELRYNDWVNVKSLSYPVQVKAITRKKIGYHTQGNMTRLHYAQLVDVTPIELTPEHLEKNDFLKLYEDTYLGWGVKAEFGEVHHMFSTSSVSVPFVYVSEFQHLLDVIGLIKMSQDFKV